MSTHDSVAIDIDRSSLLNALSGMLNLPVTDATCQTQVLHGGTVGDVRFLHGDAFTRGGIHPYKLVLKTQRAWERYGDPLCWRREYDIYASHIVDELPDQITLPRAYLLEEEDGVTRIWMEHIDGKTGSEQLHADELAFAAKKLGEFQADFYLAGRRHLSCFRPFPAVRSSFDLWRGRWGKLAGLLSAPMEDFPDELRRALSGYAERAEALLRSFERLPLTLCQGDVHHDNLILREDADGVRVYLIDWDCAGYGHMGGDAVDVLMEAFVYSSRDVALLPEYRRRIIESYCEGVRSRGVDFGMDDALVRDMFVLAWGFRIADLYMNYYKDDAFAQNRHADILHTMLGQ